MELKSAADILWPYNEDRLNKVYQYITENPKQNIEIEPNIQNIFLALIGYSTECLFKGYIIFDNPSFVSNGKLSSKLKTHNLIELASLAKIELLNNERIFCNQAYRSMIVEFRYPIDKDIDSNHILEMGGHCKDVFTNLFNKLYPKLKQLKI